jgi:hypothetical protein
MDSEAYKYITACVGFGTACVGFGMMSVMLELIEHVGMDGWIISLDRLYT